MKYKVIACKVFQHEIEFAAKNSPHELDIEFMELGEHARPAELRRKLQEKISECKNYDAILLGYGLCGRATDGLKALKIPLIIPRSHDCCGILLGDRLKFEEIFKDMPSTPFSSIGYIENGEYYFTDGDLQSGDNYQALVAEYGEADAKYIYEAMHPKLDGQLQGVYFISIPEIPAAEARLKCLKQSCAEGREFKDLTGSLRLISKLLCGNWPDDEFLTVNPGFSTAQVGDWDKIIKAIES